MAINITIKLSGHMIAWLADRPRKVREIVEHISTCAYFNDRDRHPIKYVEVQLADRHVCCISNADGTVLKEIPDGGSSEDLVEWIGTNMLCTEEVCEEACHYSEIFVL